MVVTMVEAESAWAIAVGDAIRRELGLRRQRWLAEQTGLDPATISKIIKGQQAANLDQIDLLARAFGTTRRYLLAKAGYVEPGQGIDLDSLPADVRRTVEVILREFSPTAIPEEGTQDGAPLAEPVNGDSSDGT